MSDKLDKELAEYGKNELLHQAIDRAVLGGRMRIEAAKDALDMYGSKCLVDEKTMQVTLEGLPLDKGLEKIIAERPLWQPQGDDPNIKARSELEAAALAGNVSAHGQLWKALGDVGYEAWKKKHAAAPGKKAADDGRKRNADGTFADDPDKDTGTSNPFTKAGWNLSEQGRAYKNDPERAARLAKSAGVAFGATRPVQ